MPVNSIASLNNQSDAEIGDVLIIPTASQVERLRLGSKKSTRKVVRESHGEVRLEVSSSKRESSEATRNARPYGIGICERRRAELRTLRYKNTGPAHPTTRGAFVFFYEATLPG